MPDTRIADVSRERWARELRRVRRPQRVAELRLPDAPAELDALPRPRGRSAGRHGSGRAAEDVADEEVRPQECRLELCAGEAPRDVLMRTRYRDAAFVDHRDLHE